MQKFLFVVCCFVTRGFFNSMPFAIRWMLFRNILSAISFFQRTWKFWFFPRRKNCPALCQCFYVIWHHLRTALENFVQFVKPIGLRFYGFDAKFHLVQNQFKFGVISIQESEFFQRHWLLIRLCQFLALENGGLWILVYPLDFSVVELDHQIL